MIKTFFGLTAMAFLPALAQAQSDECGTAGAIGPGVTAYDTTGATTSAPAWPCAAGGSDIWYTYSTPMAMDVTLDTCNGNTGYDSALEVFSGTCPAGLVSVGCNDDFCGLQSTLSFTANAGVTYYIRVGGFAGNTGTGDLTLTEAVVPPGISNQDDCANAGMDVIGAGSYGFNNAGATTGTVGQGEAGCYKFGTSGIQSDVWATYVAGMNGTVTMDTCAAGGSNADTKIAAYPVGPCPTIDGTSVACNDDTCGLRSQISFAVSCGQSYLIQLGSFPGSGDGSATLTIAESGTACGPGPIGSPTACSPLVNNSTGSPALISAFGEVSLSAMDVRLSCDNVPTGQFGIFFTSQTLGAVPMPGGSTGTICVLGNQGRYNMPSQIFMGAGLNSPVPTGGLQVGNIPVPVNPPIAAFTAETWYFQAWYRDAGNTNNFSDVIQITFQ